MGTTQEQMPGNWLELEGQVQQRWGKLTKGDLAQMSGKTEELVGALQLRYGYGKVQAEIEIKNWLSNHDSANTKG